MDSPVHIPFLAILFSNHIRDLEIPAFRGSVIGKVPGSPILFHNHTDLGYRFSYPLIQYKTIKGKAALVCLGEGTKEIGVFFASADLNLSFSGREINLNVENVIAKKWLLQTWTSNFYYRMHKWLPFNKNNYQKYQACEGMIQRIELLQSILKGNILSMAKGLGCFFENRVTCEITKIGETRLYEHKDVLLEGIDIQFKTNVYIPNFVGLGKGVSMGFGQVIQIRNHNNRTYDDTCE